MSDHTAPQGRTGGDDYVSPPREDVPPKPGGNYQRDPADVLDYELTEAAAEGGS